MSISCDTSTPLSEIRFTTCTVKCSEIIIHAIGEGDDSADATAIMPTLTRHSRGVVISSTSIIGDLCENSNVKKVVCFNFICGFTCY